jgi:hypothetical protein
VLLAGAPNLRVLGTMDNNATIYINGTQVGYVQSGWCIANGISLTAPDSNLNTGSNVLAIRGHDYGEASYLDVQVLYDVNYSINALNDPTKAYKAGSVAPLNFQLLESDGNNVSSEALVVHAAGLTHVDGVAVETIVDACKANPDSDFRYDSMIGGYIFNLATKGLAAGSWELAFTLDGDEDAT